MKLNQINNNKKGQFDFEFDEENMIGIAAGVVTAIIVLIIMKRVEGINIIFKIMGGVLGLIIGYFLGAKIGAGE